MKKVIFPLILYVLPCCLLTAQNTTSSPASMFGLGELSTGDGGQYAGLGGIGISLRNDHFLNTANPAALTAIDSRRFVFDTGVMGAYKSYTQTGITNSSITGNLNNLAIGCKILPRWYGALFLAPVSSMGYAITLENEVAGTSGTTVSSLFEGSGGLSKIGFSNAYLFGKKLSVGVNLSYIGGTLTQSETQGSASIEESSFKHTYYADFGIQYTIPVNKEKKLILGATYGYSQDLKQDNSLSASSTSGGNTIEEDVANVRQALPQFVSAGISYHSSRWFGALEYKYLDWSRMQSSRSIIRYQNQHKVSIGGGYTAGNIYRKPVTLLLGAGISNSYVVIQKKEAQNYYISTGANFTLPAGNILSLGIKYNDQFNATAGMQREKGVSLFLNLSFWERTYRAKLK